MGVFNQLMGEVESGLEGQKGSLAKLVLSGLENEGKGSSGLTNLISQFKQAGLGDVVQSWISKDEASKEVTPGQVQQALGDDKVQELAQKAGLPKQAFLVQLAAMLPKVVEALTSQGQAPAAGAPNQQPGEAEAPAQHQTQTAASAVGHTDPTEPVQSADGNTEQRAG